jgi:sugar phosphate isomerase/epimerase
MSTTGMDRLGVGMLSVFGLAPVKLVNLAADLGCHYVSTALQGMPLVPLSYPRFSLTDDAGLRQSVLAAMNDRGVTIPLGDGFLVLPGSDVSAFGTDLDVLAELGVPRINVVSLDPDLPRSFDQFAALTELAAEPGIQTLLEPVPDLTVGDLPTALAALEHVGRPAFRLLIDTMHLIRTGSGAADLTAIDPAHIGYAQLNDTTLRSRSGNYLEEAMFERMVPGEGELPLRDILSALPSDNVIELEVPRWSLALDGVSPTGSVRASRRRGGCCPRFPTQRAPGAAGRTPDRPGRRMRAQNNRGRDYDVRIALGPTGS